LVWRGWGEGDDDLCEGGAKGLRWGNLGPAPLDLRVWWSL
jgi:hypothetical protein